MKKDEIKKEKLNEVLEKQLLGIEKLLQKPELQKLIPNFLICSPNQEEIVDFCEAYLERMIRYKVFSQTAFFEQIKYPYQSIESGKRFFDSLIYSALNHRQNEYTGLLLIDVTDWKMHMAEQDFQDWLNELSEYTNTMRIVFLVCTSNVNIDNLSYQINRVIPVLSYCMTCTSNEIISHALNSLNNKNLEFEKEEDKTVLGQMLEIERCDTFGQMENMLNRMISYTYKDGYIGTKELRTYMDRLLQENRMGTIKKVGF